MDGEAGLRHASRAHEMRPHLGARDRADDTNPEVPLIIRVPLRGSCKGSVGS